MPLRLLILLMGLTGLAGCGSSAVPVRYQLQADEALQSPRSSRGVAVLLGPVALADYLQQETLVQRLDDDKVTHSPEARWAGGLQDNVSRLLLHRLSGHLNSSRLVFYAEREGFRHDVQALIRIDRLDSGPHQPAVLEAQWRLLDDRGEQRTSRIFQLQEKHGPSLDEQVKAQSLLLQKLAEQLSKDIQWTALEVEADNRARAAAAANTKSKANARGSKRNGGSEAESSEAPAAGSSPRPLRTDMGVYRF